VQLADAVDIEAEDGLFSNKKSRQVDASVLHEMSHQKGNGGCQSYHHEEWQAGYAGDLSKLRHQDVQNRQELGQTVLFDIGVVTA